MNFASKKLFFGATPIREAPGIFCLFLTSTALKLLVKLSALFVPLFDENRIIMLSVVFSFSQFSSIIVIVFKKKISTS